MNHDGDQFKLYHGSHIELEPGTVLRGRNNAPSYATNSLDEASGYAGQRANAFRSPKGFVYEVGKADDMSHVDLPKPGIFDDDAGVFSSKSGFQVIGKVKDVEPTTSFRKS